MSTNGEAARPASRRRKVGIALGAVMVGGVLAWFFLSEDGAWADYQHAQLLRPTPRPFCRSVQ